MEATSSTINNDMKKEVIKAVKILLERKEAKKAMPLMRIEYGNAFMKIPLKDYMKIVERQAIEQDEIMKNSLTKIYKEIGQQKFRELIEEAKNYTDEQFITDIKELFGESEVNFLQTEIKRLKYANDSR